MAELSSVEPQSFLTLPVKVLQNIIKFLPQQALINLATTNYEFYHPCLQQLYSKIVISQYAPLRLKITKSDHRREVDFQDSTRSVIYGFENSLKEGLNMKMIHARILVLNQALQINPELAGYVKEVHILGDEYSDDVIAAVQSLASILKQLDIFYIDNEKIRSKVDLSHLKLRRAVVDNVNILGDGIEGLLVGSIDKIGNLSSIASNLKELIPPFEEDSYWKWIRTNMFPDNVHFSKLEKFRLVFHPSAFNDNISLIKLIRWSNITELEIVVPYPQVSNIEDYVFDCFDAIPSQLPRLNKLSIVQGSVFPTHEINESYDLTMFNFINTYIEHLSYLSIKHSVPQLGNFPDGFEGNYHRRYELYTTILPKLLTKSSKSTSNFILDLPNLFHTFTCYEQYMNTVIWNGCKCEYCDIYLDKLDHFLFQHKYFDQDSQRYKDMNASHLLASIASNLNKRLIPSSSLLTQLDQPSFPIWKCIWDFHSIENSKKFKCLEKLTIDQGEYDEGDYPDEEQVEICESNKNFFARIPKAISHYMNDVIQEILNLHRGNAEARFDEQDLQFLKDGGDYDDLHQKSDLKKVLINGFAYNIDNELNGTHFYENVYDE
ncbi:hypothetical protein CANMA_000218 [Candida margitis]|uniref:uncharacterized protein n=1 Tax=Candida margitis TaxID=1775924 RepID=UPI00222696E6|nr:uncharacterized protein CANMA_000218 [Candida margitis]KAI5970799.1 hypothetical protein CANMA_000218 [Candida margitis]